MSGDTNRPTDTMYSGSEGSAQPQIADGGPAFPTEPNTQKGFYKHHGMSLRDWLAGQAVSGFTANQTWLENAKKRASDKPLGQIVSEASYAVADAMLKARSE